MKIDRKEQIQPLVDELVFVGWNILLITNPDGSLEIYTDDETHAERLRLSFPDCEVMVIDTRIINIVHSARNYVKRIAGIKDLKRSITELEDTKK